MNKIKILLLAVVVGAVSIFYAFDGQQYLTVDFFQTLYKDDPG